MQAMEIAESGEENVYPNSKRREKEIKAAIECGGEECKMSVQMHACFMIRFDCVD